MINWLFTKISSLETKAAFSQVTQQRRTRTELSAELSCWHKHKPSRFTAGPAGWAQEVQGNFHLIFHPPKSFEKHTTARVLCMQPCEKTERWAGWEDFTAIGCNPGLAWSARGEEGKKNSVLCLHIALSETFFSQEHQPCLPVTETRRAAEYRVTRQGLPRDAHPVGQRLPPRLHAAGLFMEK